MVPIGNHLLSVWEGITCHKIDLCPARWLTENGIIVSRKATSRNHFSWDQKRSWMIPNAMLLIGTKSSVCQFEIEFNLVNTDLRSHKDTDWIEKTPEFMSNSTVPVFVSWANGGIAVEHWQNMLESIIMSEASLYFNCLCQDAFDLMMRSLIMYFNLHTLGNACQHWSSIYPQVLNNYLVKMTK